MINQTAFISGHMDLTQEEFDKHYIPEIDKALGYGFDFVIGDAIGADSMAQEYVANALKSDKYKELYTCVTVYHMFEHPRNNKGNAVSFGKFKTDEERDSAMTSASDYDIAWIRKGKEKSGTAKNILRRRTMSG